MVLILSFLASPFPKMNLLLVDLILQQISTGTKLQVTEFTKNDIRLNLIKIREVN